MLIAGMLVGSAFFGAIVSNPLSFVLPAFVYSLPPLQLPSEPTLANPNSLRLSPFSESKA